MKTGRMMVVLITISSLSLIESGKATAQMPAPQPPLPSSVIPLERPEGSTPETASAAQPPLPRTDSTADARQVRPSRQAHGPRSPGGKPAVGQLKNPFESGGGHGSQAGGQIASLQNPFEWGGKSTRRGLFGLGSPQTQPTPQATAPEAVPGPPIQGLEGAPAVGAAPGVPEVGGAAPAPGAIPGAGGAAPATPFPGAATAGADDFAAAVGGEGPGFGGGLAAGAASVPGMIGDMSPYTLMKAIAVPPIPTPFPPPRPGVSPVTRTAKSIAGVVPAVRGFKVADNQSPRPTDRVFSSFNFFDNVNRALNERLGAPIQNMLVYRQVYGFEKTFFDESASIGIRVPINSMTIQSNPRFGGLGGTSSAFGNVNVFAKLILWEDNAGSLISAGLAVDIPTGPSTFAGFPSTLGKNVTDLQPFLGYIFTNGGNWFVQGFGSVAVPTDAALPTMMFLDAALGYYIYRNNDPGSFLTAIVPTFETHVNIPLNHSSLNFNDTYGTPTVVDLTFGLNTEVYRRGVLTLGYALPVTGPAPFSGEFMLLFNWRFGAGRQRPATGIIPPVIGG
jgi:hypothetical protein